MSLETVYITYVGWDLYIIWFIKQASLSNSFWLTKPLGDRSVIE